MFNTAVQVKKFYRYCKRKCPFSDEFLQMRFITKPYNEHTLKDLQRHVQVANLYKPFQKRAVTRTNENLSKGSKFKKLEILWNKLFDEKNDKKELRIVYFENYRQKTPIGFCFKYKHGNDVEYIDFNGTIRVGSHSDVLVLKMKIA